MNTEQKITAYKQLCIETLIITKECKFKIQKSLSRRTALSDFMNVLLDKLEARSITAPHPGRHEVLIRFPGPIETPLRNDPEILEYVAENPSQLSLESYEKEKRQCFIQLRTIKKEIFHLGLYIKLLKKYLPDVEKNCCIQIDYLRPSKTEDNYFFLI